MERTLPLSEDRMCLVHSLGPVLSLAAFHWVQTASLDQRVTELEQQLAKLRNAPPS